MILEGQVEAQAKEIITYILVALGLLLAACKGFFLFRGWYRELKEGREVKERAKIEGIHATAQAEISGERELSNRLERVGSAQEDEIRLLWMQLQRAQHTIKGHEFTIERQRRALIECWQGHSSTKHYIDVMVELEKTAQRQDQLDARMPEEEIKGIKRDG